MLDSLGSTLSLATIDAFFIRYGKKPREDHLTFAEAVQCLENELGKPESEKKRLDLDGSDPSTMSGTPNVMTESESRFMKLSIGDLDFAGPGFKLDDRAPSSTKPSAPPPYSTEPPMMPVPEIAGDPTKDNSVRPAAEPGLQPISSSPSREMSYSSSDAEADDSSSSSGRDAVERVINVKNCPLCHRPRLNSKAEVDIVTHLAVCASQDWAKVDQIVVGNFVTASQAQRKWYTKIITKVSSGDYKLGAVS
jgi:phosphatidylserine decarboxylase